MMKKSLVSVLSVIACACSASPTSMQATPVSADGVDVMPASVLYTTTFGDGTNVVISDAPDYVSRARTCDSDVHLPDGNEVLVTFFEDGTSPIVPGLLAGPSNFPAPTVTLFQVSDNHATIADSAVSGTVTITKDDGLAGLSGSYDAVLASGAHIAGSFTSKYSSTLFCCAGSPTCP